MWTPPDVRRLAATLRFLAFLPLSWASSAAAQTVTDDDTLKQGGITYRLWGIDSPQLLQTGGPPGE